MVTRRHGRRRGPRREAVGQGEFVQQGAGSDFRAGHKNQSADRPSVRIATADDAQTLADFNRAMARETEARALPPAVILAGVNAVLADPRHGFYVVAEVRQQLVASLLVTTEWSDWRNGQFWWIQSVYVVREWRRRGLYRALYAHVKRLATSARVCGFRLYVERENHIAQKTYAALGMSETRYKIYEEISDS